MPEKLEVYWTERSLRNAKQIQDYLSVKFSDREVNNFEVSLRNFERNVTIFPNLYPESIKYPGLRKAVLHKYTTVFYVVETSKIVVISMQDNRQEKPSD